MTTVIGIPMIFIAVLIFALLFRVISKTLQQRPLLGGNADVVLSLCVAALCVLSVFRVTPVPTASPSQDPISPGFASLAGGYYCLTAARPPSLTGEELFGLIIGVRTVNLNV